MAAVRGRMRRHFKHLVLPNELTISTYFSKDSNAFRSDYEVISMGVAMGKGLNFQNTAYRDDSR